MVLEEGIGPVPVEVTKRGSQMYCHLVVEKEVEVPPVKAVPAAAAATLSLPANLVLDSWFASAGVPFCFVRLADRAAVDRAVLDRPAWAAHFAQAWSPHLYFFAGDSDLYVRMFAPALGIEEDPATGSGAVALAGVLAARAPEGDGVLTWRIDQGVAMGRPSRIEASAEKRAGRVRRIKVGGATRLVAEGTMDVPAEY
jgi:trans-2,3-dihydro-3-hydroxyanthranilate isomerase